MFYFFPKKKATLAGGFLIILHWLKEILWNCFTSIFRALHCSFRWAPLPREFKNHGLLESKVLSLSVAYYYANVTLQIVLQPKSTSAFCCPMMCSVVAQSSIRHKVLFGCILSIGCPFTPSISHFYECDLVSVNNILLTSSHNVGRDYALRSLHMVSSTHRSRVFVTHTV